jgi:transposase
VPAPDDSPWCRPCGGADLSRYRRRARTLPNSKAVGAVFGLTPSKYQSGEINRTGAISKCGDEMMRVMLYEAAQIVLVRLANWSWLKAWAMKIARHRGLKKAIVALARRLAVIMHRIWVDGTGFRWTREVAAA